jgi:hypothetical protein
MNLDLTEKIVSVAAGTLAVGGVLIHFFKSSIRRFLRSR